MGVTLAPRNRHVVARRQGGLVDWQSSFHRRHQEVEISRVEELKDELGWALTARGFAHQVFVLGDLGVDSLDSENSVLAVEVGEVGRQKHQLTDRNPPALKVRRRPQHTLEVVIGVLGVVAENELDFVGVVVCRLVDIDVLGVEHAVKLLLENRLAQRLSDTGVQGQNTLVGSSPPPSVVFKALQQNFNQIHD